MGLVVHCAQEACSCWQQRKIVSHAREPKPAKTSCIMCLVHEGSSVYQGGYHEYIGEYLEYTKGCSVLWRDIMSTLGGRGYNEYIQGYHNSRRGAN